MSLAEVRRYFYAPQVRDLMTPDPLTLLEDDTVATLIKLMQFRSIRHVPIVNDEGGLVGLVTQRDFLSIAVSKLAHLSPNETEELYRHLTMRDFMGRKVVTVTPQTSLREAASIMFSKKFGCLPVLEKERLVGIITEADYVRSFLDWNVRFGGE